MDKSGRKDSIIALHRENIIGAADELFTLNGFDRTTMDDIATKAQYSKRTIYTYFDSKEEIYSHFVLKGVVMLAAEISKAISFSDNFIERYQEICAVLLNFHNKQFPYYEGVMMFFNRAELSDPSPVIKEIYGSNHKINKSLEAFFKQGQEQGIILQNVDIKKLVLIVWCNIIAFIEMIDKKNAYINTTLHSTTEEFTSFGFKLILNAVLDAG